MSTSPIISSLSYSNPAVTEDPVQSSPQQQPAQIPGTNAQDIEDTVHLSQFAQMAQQGGSPSVIASTTGLTVSAVDSDLGIPTASSSVTVAAPRGYGGEHPAAPGATSHSGTAAPTPALSVRA